jgi:hypothetical protein
MDLSLQNIHMNMNYGLGELASSYQVLKNWSKGFKWAWNVVNMYQALDTGAVWSSKKPLLWFGFGEI